MRHFFFFWALLIGLSVSASAQNMLIQVAQESAPGIGDFDANVVGTVQAFKTTGTVADFYGYTGNATTGTTGSFSNPDVSLQNFRNHINTMFVLASDGFGFINVHGPRQGQGANGNLIMTSQHDLDSGVFQTPFDVRDDPADPDDTYTFGTAAGRTTPNTRVTVATSAGGNTSDGFATRFSDAEPVIISQLTFSGVSVAGWTAHGADGTNLSLSQAVGRRIRFNVTWAVDPVSNPTVADAPGWRLLSPPFGGVDVLDLAAINFVGGVPAGATNAAQYPGMGYINARGQLAGNLFHEYQGVESIRNQADTADSTAVIYSPVPNSDYVIQAGRGIWWYWYDQPFDLQSTRGGGVGVSYDLADANFSLETSGTPRLADVSVTFPLATVLPLTYDGDGNGLPDLTVPQDYFYMGGNPFAAPFNVNGISASGGMVQDLVYTWDPTANGGAGNHVPLARGGAGTFAAVWQGLMIEITPTGTTGPTVTYDFESTDGAESPLFYGKGGHATPEALPEFAFTLSGDNTEDKAWLRFLPDAEDGWDAKDATKYSRSPAQIAFVGDDGRRLGMSSLSDGTAGPLARNVRVMLDFVASEAGTYTLAWEGGLAKDWTATLVDRETRRRINMHRSTSYTFESEATDWTERFVVRVRPARGARTAKTSEVESAFAVGQPYPNPASGASRIEVVVDEAQDVKVAVYDALGREVAVAQDGPLAEGDHVVALPVSSLSAGTYVVRVTGVSMAETRRLTVVR